MGPVRSNDPKINFHLSYEYTQLTTLSQQLRGSNGDDLPTSADKYITATREETGLNSYLLLRSAFKYQ